MIQYAKKLIASTKEMPLTSPIRKGLIQIISKDVRVKDVAADLGVTPPTIYNALNSAQNLALSMASRPNQKRARVEDVDIELAIQFLDDVAPIPSGREYRLVRVTYENLYAMYVGFCNDRNAGPLGKTFFIDNVLHSTGVRHSADETHLQIVRRKKKVGQALPPQRQGPEEVECAGRARDVVARAGPVLFAEEERADIWGEGGDCYCHSGLHPTSSSGHFFSGSHCGSLHVPRTRTWPPQARVPPLRGTNERNQQ